MHEFKLPDVGEGISEGELVEWFVAVGDEILEGQTVAEVATDKVSVELPSPASGTVTDLKVEEGEVVPVGAVILVLDGGRTEAFSGSDREASAAVDTREPVSEAQSLTESTAVGAAELNSIVAAPSTRRAAAQLGIDLDTLQGSGPSGRIVLADVEAAHDWALKPSPDVASAAAEDRREELQGVRRIMARQMAKSARVTATSTTTFEVHADRLAKLVDDLRDEEGNRRFGPLPIVLKCLAAALLRHDRLNATIDQRDEALVLQEQVDIAIAVDTPKGLTVPVVRRVADRTLAEVAASVRSVAERARQGTLTREEMVGGSFTVSSTGGLERATIISTTPIINLPHVATMWVSRIVPRVRVAPSGKLEAGPLMTCSLSFDHRFIDGAEATTFINDVASFLEQPERALL